MAAGMKVNPYLNFNGNTEQAFKFYKSVFGGEFNSVMRFKDMPPGEPKFPEKEAERIMHISLPIGDGFYLMGSDTTEMMDTPFVQGNNLYISLHPDSLKEGERLFKALSEGGVIEMPFSKAFWGAYFGSFTDKFGVKWMINYEESK